MSSELMTITLEEYRELNEAWEVLECLENSGVESWDGYEGAMELLEWRKENV